MRGPFYLLLAGFLFTALLFSHAQDSQAPSAADALHAPDGNAHEMIMSIFVSPLSGAPFKRHWRRSGPSTS